MKHTVMKGLAAAAILTVALGGLQQFRLPQRSTSILVRLSRASRWLSTTLRCRR